ncbi:VirB3 family type IV secretion system protein [Albidovulum sp.]|uniref:VirB3 family type IV secretion system protein n=1 Tax=Albidovulum sp. TaxID=1872424 RepID=UPI0025C4A2A4|nr:VirB3 family type IV secretion system protein [Defluviimonas sp.]
MATATRTTRPLYRSLARPDLLYGVERDLFLLEAMLAMFGIFFVPAFAWKLVVAGILFLVAHPLLVRVAKVDPRFSRVYLRSLPYLSHYPAGSHADVRRQSLEEFRAGVER